MVVRHSWIYQTSVLAYVLSRTPSAPLHPVSREAEAGEP